MNKHQKFLEFNGKTITFLSIDGTYWIALKPICEALEVEYSRSFKNAKNDPILGPALAVQPMQVSKNGRKQLRKVTCIPEYLVYGWLFSIKSESKELIEYKRTCYRLLYDHFHGTITNRKEVIIERDQLKAEAFELKQTLRDSDDGYKKLHDINNKIKLLSTQLNTMDKELIKQPELFS